jgi:hypothetical protein
MTDKTVNYTDDQTVELVNRYQAGEAVEALAEAFGKSTRSIVAKLSREKVYVAKTKAAGTGRVTKANLINDLADRCEVDRAVLESLEKASLEALQVLHAKLA